MAKRKVPKYWENHLQAKASEIKSNQERAGEDYITFALISDLHWGYSRKNTGKVLKRLTELCDISYCFNGGDTVSGHPYFTKQGLFQDMKEYHKEFSEVEEKMLLVMGNHDAAYATTPPLEGSSTYEKNLTKKELYNHYFKYLRKYPNRVFGDDAYYFVDDEKKKARYVVLNTHDVPNDHKRKDGSAIYNSFRMFCLGGKQLEWFANVALNVPSREWSVILCTHENKNANEKHITTNQPLLDGVINAFKTGGKFKGDVKSPVHKYLDGKVDVDFTGKGGNFIGWLAGHEHRDDLKIDEYGVAHIIIATDSSMMGCPSKVYHIGNSDSEHSIDVFTVSKKERKVYVTRVGWGKNREFSF